MQDLVPTPAGVQCSALRKEFPGGVVALDGVDVSCDRGSILVLVGPSGCGKTTLLRCIAGLDTPTAGRVLLDGRDVTRVEAGRRDVAMVFQNYGLYPDKTAFGNVEFPLRMARVPRRQAQRRVAEVADLLRIAHLLDRRPAQLSGGQRQRVGIARALVRQPKVLLMDEPLSNLDAELRGEMRAELLALQRRLKTTVVHVTHDQTEALSMADRLYVLADGRVEQAGPPRAVFDSPATRFVAKFLGGMNLVDARRSGDRVMGADGSITFALENARTLPEVATVGFRPEDVRLGPGPPGALTLDGEVAVSELLGRDRLLHLRCGRGEGMVRLRVSADEIHASQLTAHVPAAAVHLFDRHGDRVLERNSLAGSRST